MNFKSVIATVLALTMVLGVSAQNSLLTQKQKKMKALEMNIETFKQEVYDFTKNPDTWTFNGDLPVVIDFFATWCGPCKMLSPVLDKLAGEYDGRIKVFKVDVDKEPELASMFRVRSVPTLVFVPKDANPMVMTGGMGIEGLRKIVDDNLLKK